MPLVRIDLPAGKPPAHRQAIADCVYRTMHEVLSVPENDRFMVISEHAPGDLIADPTYLDIARSPDCVLIQITLNAGRSVELKQRFYARLADTLHERAGLRREDVFVSLVEVAKENWSFGNGVAQYV